MAPELVPVAGRAPVPTLSFLPTLIIIFTNLVPARETAPVKVPVLFLWRTLFQRYVPVRVLEAAPVQLHFVILIPTPMFTIFDPPLFRVLVLNSINKGILRPEICAKYREPELFQDFYLLIDCNSLATMNNLPTPRHAMSNKMKNYNFIPKVPLSPFVIPLSPFVIPLSPFVE